MSKMPRWTPEEDAVLREFYMSAPRGRRYLAVHKKLPGRTKHAVAGRARYSGLVRDEKTRVITKFLRDAAEEGWHMRPDKVTRAMEEAPAAAWGFYPAKTWRDMCEAAPKFELDK